MITPEVISYIKTERAKGTPDSVIKSNLLANGWSENSIVEATSSLSVSVISGLSNSSISTSDLKEYRNKVNTSYSSSKEENIFKAVGKSVLKFIGIILVATLIGVGIIFAGCVFLFSGTRL